MQTLNRPVRGGSTWLVPLAFLLLGCLPYCELGGGMSSSSVTVPGEDGRHVKATAAQGETTATLVLERTTRDVVGSGEVRYVFDKTLVEQELRLELNDEAAEATFILEDRDEASGFDSHRLEISPDGSRVAYKLGTQPWGVVYVLSPTVAVHSDLELEELDWGRVPDLDTAFDEVFAAQRLRLDGRFDFHKRDRLLLWYEARHGEDGLSRKLFELLDVSDHDWDRHTEMLSPSGKAKLKDQLREAVESGSQRPADYSKAWFLRAIEIDKLPAAAVKSGARTLAADELTVKNYGADLAEYLRVHASHDPQDAAGLACSLVVAEDPPYALDKGRPLQLVAFAVLGTTDHDCAKLRDFAPDPCATTCGGSPCDVDQLASSAAKVLAEPVQQPEYGKTPEDTALLAHLVLAAHARVDPEVLGCGE